MVQRLRRHTAPVGQDVTIDYVPPPKVMEFANSPQKYRMIMGPWGSGKTTGCIQEMVRRAQLQDPYPIDGIRRTRWAAIRNCYDDQTEILTEKRGWKFFRDLKENDKVATLVDDQLVFQLPERVYAAPYQGEMIGFEGEAVDFLVTPNHKMYVSKKTTRKQVWGPYEVRTAEEIYGSTKYRVKKDAVWEGEPSRFTEDQFEWLGYWFAEGSDRTYHPHRRQIVITTLTDYEYAKDVFERAGIPYSANPRGDGGFNFLAHKNIHPIFSLLGGKKAAFKAVPQEVKAAPPGHISAFLQGFLKGDGHIRKEGTRTLYTSSIQLSDDLQELALKAGMAATVKSRDRRGMAVKIGNATGVVNYKEYTITLLSNGRMQPVLQRSVHQTRHRGWYKEQYNGTVYCVEMPVIPVQVRRKGKAFWCYRTYPELKTTTMMTWLHWFPEEYFGQIWWDVPITYIMRFADVEMTIYFLALDRPEHTRKLLSLELTGAFINEAREVPKAVWDDLDGRVGRFPPHKVVPCNWQGVIADTNPPDEDHWIPEFFEEESEMPLDEEKYKLFKQPSGLSANPDNRENLRPGYYPDMSKGHTKPWIDVYVHGKYGSISGDRRVYTEFDQDRHVSPVPLKPNPNLPIYVGFDYGLTPACVVVQLDNHGTRMVVLKEILATSIAPDGMGIRRYIRTAYREAMVPFLSYEIIAFGDPTGSQRAPTDEKSVEDILREEGIPIQGAPTNNFIARRESIAEYLERHNGFLLDPSCKVLKKGFIKGYKYKRVRVQNEDRWTDVVDKVGNHYTHPQDGLQAIGVGIKGVIRKNKVKKMMAAHQQRPKHPLYREAESA